MENSTLGHGQRAQELRALATLAEGSGLVPKTYVVPGGWTPLSGFHGQLHALMHTAHELPFTHTYIKQTNKQNLPS